MGSWVKCLLCKAGSLSSNPQHPYEKAQPGRSVILAPGRWRLGDPSRSLARQSKSVSSRQSERPCLKVMQRATEEDPCHQSILDRHTYMCVLYPHEQVCIYTQRSKLQFVLLFFPDL